MSEKKHLTPVFIVYVDGKRLDTEHEGSLKTITIDDRLNGTGAFSMVFDSAETKVMDKELISLESEVSIHLGYKDDVQEVFFGEVTMLKAVLRENSSEQLEVTGFSFLYKLATASHFRSFEGKKPSDVIKGMLDSYSLKAKVDDFGVPRDFQSEEKRSDYKYLINMASMYGKQVYADGFTVYVKDEITVRKDEVILEWGKSLISFESNRNIKDLVSGINFIGWDPLKNEPFAGKGAYEDLPVKIGGQKDWTKKSKAGASRYAASDVSLNVHDSDEAKQLAVGELQNNSYLFSHARGKAQGNYKLRPGMRVTIKMTGEKFEGEYMAERVIHHFDRKSGYITEFELKRNMCV